jgi:CDP-diacylglycerol--serine O-phosphatidyltransferase
MVTSGVVPGVIMFNMIHNNSFDTLNLFDDSFLEVALLGLLLTLGACYRLAKFNLDTRQSDSFIGLPTPAMSLFVISLPLIQQSSEIEFVQNLISNNYFLIITTLLLTYIMNAEIPLFSLKFKNYSFQKNWIIYVFLLFSLLLILLLNYLSIPIIIMLYVILSLVKNLTPKI